MAITKVLGIVNVTRDSFTDGGQYLHADAAVAHARRLIADGAYAVDLGAESTHPDAEDVSVETEIERLDPVIRRLKSDGVRVSADTYKPAVMRHVLGLGVDFINDITALRDPESVAAVRDGEAKLILMHSLSSRARAQRHEADPTTIVNAVVRFFKGRVGELERAGVARERMILDPGMGFFLGTNPEASLAALRGLRRLVELGMPVLASTSRKSFIGALLADADGSRPTAERGAGTLATEIWAALQGVEYIRTHDVRALCDALTIMSGLTKE